VKSEDDHNEAQNHWFLRTHKPTLTLTLTHRLWKQSGWKNVFIYMYIWCMQSLYSAGGFKINLWKTHERAGFQPNFELGTSGTAIRSVMSVGQRSRSSYSARIAALCPGQQHAGTLFVSSHLPLVIYGERLDLKTVIASISVMKIEGAEVGSYCSKNVWNAYLLLHFWEATHEGWCRISTTHPMMLYE
jgi:hypothetical protein